MAFSTTLGQCFIVDVVDLSQIEIQFVPPEFSQPRKADLNGAKIIGRNHERLFYTGGRDTLSMVLDFYSDTENRTDVIEKIEWLRSLTMNDGNNGSFRNVKIVFGELFLYHIWAISDVTPVMSHFDSENGFLPMRAQVTLKFILDPDKNLLLSDVRRPA